MMDVMLSMADETPRPDARRYCGNCGTLYPSMVWPRTCDQCQQTAFKSPEPVAIKLIPVTDGERFGLVVGKRGIGPKAGQWALIGGFVENNGEDFLMAADREEAEETSIGAPMPTMIVSTAATGNGQILVFCMSDEVIADSAVQLLFKPSEETPEVRVIWGYEELAFPRHTEAVARFFYDPKVAIRHRVMREVRSFHTDVGLNPRLRPLEYIAHMERFLAHAKEGLFDRDLDPYSSMQSLVGLGVEYLGHYRGQFRHGE